MPWHEATSGSSDALNTMCEYSLSGFTLRRAWCTDISRKAASFASSLCKWIPSTCAASLTSSSLRVRPDWPLTFARSPRRLMLWSTSMRGPHWSSRGMGGAASLPL